MVLGWGRRAEPTPTTETTTESSSSTSVPQEAAEQDPPPSVAEHQQSPDSVSVTVSVDDMDNATMSSSLAQSGQQKNGLSDDDGGGPASSTLDGEGQQQQQPLQNDNTNNNGEEGMATEDSTTQPPPLFPSLSGGVVGINNNYPTNNNDNSTKKLKRDRSGGGNSSSNSGSGGRKGNVTRIDVYPNGESYVTSPDGTTTKTMATISTSSGQQKQPTANNNNTGGGKPIFQFTSNTNAASSGGGGGGNNNNNASSGGGSNNNTTPSLKGFFTPGVGAKGISSAPTPTATGGGVSGGIDNNSSSLTAVPNNSLADGGGGGGVGESSTSLTNQSQNSSNPPIHWQPQSTTSTCEFTHTISNYSQKRDSGCKKAEYSTITTDTLGNKWRLIIYVNGNGRASNHHLSLFLQVADAEELPFGWNKSVSYVLTLEHPQGQSLGYAKRNPDKTFKLCPKAIDWGWSQFITSDRIQQDGYVNKNTLTVRASVSVKSSSVNIDPEDAELYLKCAVEEGNAEAVKICLGQNASVNCQFKDDLYTPLHTACSANNHGDGGSASSSTPTNSNSPSPGPISEGCLEVLDLLLERDADVNACNKWRETPLLIAANNGHGEAVKRLLATGADPSLCSEAGWSALTFAAHKGYDDICGMLLDASAPVNCRVTEDLSTPLHKACAGSKEGHTRAVQLLLEGDADVHALNKWRETPLLTAANHGQTEAVEALLEYGADPCKCTDTGWSPLSIAAYKGHDDVVRLLLAEGAPTEEDDPTLSALLQAATKGLPDTVMLLLRHGADHTVTTKKGDTALSILVEQNLIDASVEMVTDYAASIPRCSRDRKKVQRARLLINLRLKQMQRDGTGPFCDDSDEGESDVEPDNGRMGRALHDDPGSAPSPLTSGGSKKKKKNKGNQKSIAKQEAEARAAEEALLLELEAEENANTLRSVVSTDGGGSSKNRKKKMKKKEKERQQKAAEKAREEELRKEIESKKKAKEDADAAVKAAEEAASKPNVKDTPSPVKKEKVVELSSKHVAKQKNKADNILSPSSKKSDQNKEPSLPSPPSSSASTNNKDSKGPKKVREVSLPKSGESSTSTKKSSTSSNSNTNHANRNNKNNHHATKGHGHVTNKKIPGDNPIPKKIPGDNPIQPRKIPGDNPVVPRKIPGDNPIQSKKIPGDNPKVQQTRGQKGGATPAAKAKRGWESKNQSSQGTSTSSSSISANQKKQPKQSNKQPTPANNEKTSGKKANNVPSSSSKSSSTAPRHDLVNSPDKGKQHATNTRSDESTQSTANSTADSLPVTPTPGQKAPTLSNSSTGGASASSDVGPKASVDDQLANMANDVLGFLDFDSSQPKKNNVGQQYDSMSPPPANVQGGGNAAQAVKVLSPTPAAATPSSAAASPRPVTPTIPVELPSVSIYRLEKLNEIFRHCAEARSSATPNNPLRVIDDRTLRVVIYRWIIRASHGAEPFLDPVIPSWDDEAYLKEFLQRQFISESRRPAGEDSRFNANLAPSIEVLRDAGAAMAEICVSLARGVVEFRSKCEQQVPANWSDSDINVAGLEEGSNVVIEWSGKSRLSIPYAVFNSLARRYVGERSRLMSAIFSAVRRHEILSAIAAQTDMVCHLPLQTMDCLTKGVGASLETWSDSVSVYGNNYFCAMFPDVDAAFGGLQPFAKEKGGGETILTQAGGAVVVVAPPENATSSQCIRKMVDMAETFSGLPLSFGVVLSSDSFVNATNATLSAEDLRALDPRLCGEKKGLISFIEAIPAGCSIFSKSSCMFLLLQSEAGKLRFPAHPTAMDIIRRSMRTDIGMSNIAPPMMSNFGAMQGESQINTAASFSPMSQHQYAITPQEASLSSNPWEGGSGGGGNRGGGRGHRGRLFDLVGDEEAEEEQDGMNNLLPGMLGLDMNMFGGSNTNGEVDIEAISLMGIGLNGNSK